MVMSNPRAELSEDAQIVKYQDGIEYGYYGVTPDVEDDRVYTVAGVTEDGTAKADDSPSKTAAARSRANTAALKKGDDK